MCGISLTDCSLGTIAYMNAVLILRGRSRRCITMPQPESTHLPAPPSIHAIVAIALALLTITLYMREKYPLEATSLLILTTVLLWFAVYQIQYEGGGGRA